MSEAEIAVRVALVIALVAGVKKHAPKVSGVWTVLLSAVVSALLVFASEPEGTAIRTQVLHGLIMLGAAIGTNSWASGLADKVAPKTLEGGELLVSGTVRGTDEERAQAMFKAYNESAGGVTYDGKPIPPWDGLTDKVRANWIAAARAA